MIDPNLVTANRVNLTNCDREAIHIPGAIQPHGVLLVFSEPELQIQRLSKNTEDLLGIPAEEWLDRTLAEVLGNECAETIKRCLSHDFSHVNPLKIHLNAPKPQTFNGIVHRWAGNCILELEPIAGETQRDFFQFYQMTRGPIAQIQKAANLSELCQAIAEDIRQIAGFDRVMVYRFDADKSGTVIAEDKEEDLPSFLSLHYPATDIPEPARRLYELSLLRLIPDVNYQPGELLSSAAVASEPLDLSLSGLRSVSPIHIEYLKNMGVAASMSISLLKNKTLWGLIACHHQTPKIVPYEIRTVCEFLGQVMAIEIPEKEQREGLDYKMKLKSIQSRFIEKISQADNLGTGLVADRNALLSLVGAQGAALCVEGTLTLVGKTPQESEIQELIEWVKPQIENDIFCTNALPTLYPEAERYKEIASGVLVLWISKLQKNYVVWFRPEVLKNVNWAGNPVKNGKIEADGSLTLSPRQSFERWQETVRSHSLPWQPCEIEGAVELRSAIVGIVLRKAEELAMINLELERSNKELDAFAYIASHDLKEPLRGIHNYSNFLLEDYAPVLDEEGVTKLETLVRLTARMEDLINALLHFSRLGREELSMEQTDLNKVIENVAEVLRISKPETQVELCIPRPLPKICCDRVLIEEVLSNLIGNALKYNKNGEKRVEVGWFVREENPPGGDREDAGAQWDTEESAIGFYVRDNGIGIRERHIDSVFRLFKRLHAPSKYGGGTGAGLTIVKKIIERHGGKIWVESTYGKGSTFYFTLAQ